MKKLLAIACFSTISAVSFAEGTYQPMVDHFSGLYLGGGLGYGFNLAQSYLANNVNGSTVLYHK